MAYQQQYDNYQQHQQQQSRGQPRPQQGRQHAGYDAQQRQQHYNDHGYTQGGQQPYNDQGYNGGGYEEWDDGYYTQQGTSWEGGQHGAHNDVNGQMRQPAQYRAPPQPQQHSAQEQIYDGQYQQPPRRDPRSAPIGRGNAPPALPQGRGGLRPPSKSQLNTLKARKNGYISPRAHVVHDKPRSHL
jgi:hypothetical protein